MSTTTECCIFWLVQVPNFSSNWQFWFLNQICPKRVFPHENKISEYHHWIHFKQTILNFATKFAQKGISGWKQKKGIFLLNSTHLNQSTHKISALNDNFDFSSQICPKRMLLFKHRKSEHYQWILHIQISLGTKFHFKQFWILVPNLPKKAIFCRK